LADALFYNPAFWSYSLAAFLFAAFAVRLAIAWRGGVRASVLLGAIAASALWACLVTAALSFPSGDAGWWLLACLLDAVRMGAWIAFLTLLLDGWQPGRTGRPWSNTPRWLLAVAALLIAASAFLPQSWLGAASPVSSTGAYTALLGLAILGLVLVEQLWRRTAEHGRWGVKPLVIGLAGMFAYDEFL
jgi:hypothetical protein